MKLLINIYFQGLFFFVAILKICFQVLPAPATYSHAYHLAIRAFTQDLTFPEEDVYIRIGLTEFI